MNVKTIAKLFRIASGRILGQEGFQACYHFGMAMALSAEQNTPEDDYNGYNRERDIAHQIALGQKIIKQAKRANMLTKS